MKALDLLHAKGYVHFGRCTLMNLLFPVDSKEEAKFFDFDLTSMENESYPEGYNEINECHPTAIANWPRLIRYSIVSIIEKQSFYLRFLSTQKQL